MLTVSELYADKKVGGSEEPVIDQLLMSFQLVAPSREGGLAGRLVRQ